MSDRMRPIPFAALLNWVAEEMQHSGKIFGLYLESVYHPGEGRLGTAQGQLLGSATGAAAGPHTQLAQNILTAYLAGGRFLELKTVQIMDGEAIRQAIAKPCINAADEGYNVEWSTELTVEEAYEEYVKAWFLCHVFMKELGLSDTPDFVFNMSVGYTLEGIQSPKIDAFIEGLKDAGGVKFFQDCRETLRHNLHRFTHFNEADLDAISPRICSSLTLSTMHGCPKEEIERIVTYLIREKGLDVFLKGNPTLLGYGEAARTLAAMGFSYLSFDDRHFEADLQFAEALPLLEKLLELARDKGRVFGVKLTNTLPVRIKREELPGEEMYASGRALLPLSVQVAKKLSEAFGSRLPLSYSGGADALNVADFVAAGIQPVTVCTTLLKPGGYQRLAQIAAEAAPVMAREYRGPDAAKIAALADKIRGEERNQKGYRGGIQSRKMESPLELYDCFKAPCKAGGCPIGQNIPAYLELAAQGRYLEAMAVIARDNAMPATLGEICYQPCAKFCTRLDYDEPLKIRTMKRLVVEEALEEFIAGLTLPKPLEKSVLILGAGVQGLSLAYFLSRRGFQVLVAEKQEKPFGILNNIKADKKLSERALELDLKLAGAYGAQFLYGVNRAQELGLGEGMDYIISTTGRKEGFAKALLTQKSRQTRLEAVYAMAEAKRLALSIIVKEEAMAPLPELRLPLETKGIYARRGILLLPREDGSEGERCLHCNDICEVCAEVCPNRANVALEVRGFADRHQILHLDALCNECGNCATFCPHAGKPYRDKLTLFGSLDDFAASKNAGFLVEGNGVLLRHRDGSEEQTTIKEIRDEKLKGVIQAVTEDYPYLLVKYGGE